MCLVQMPAQLALVASMCCCCSRHRGLISSYTPGFRKKKKPQLKHLYGCACMCVYRRLRVVSAGLAYFSGQKEQVACCFTRRQINLTGVSSSRHRSGQKRTTASWPDSCSVGWLKTPHNQTITRTLGSATAASNSGPLGCSGVAQILLLDEMLFFNQL